jgi:hypothetical protein
MAKATIDNEQQALTHILLTLLPIIFVNGLGLSSRPRQLNSSNVESGINYASQFAISL